MLSRVLFVIGAVALLTSASPLPRVVRSSGDEVAIAVDDVMKSTDEEVMMTAEEVVVARDDARGTIEGVKITEEESIMATEDAMEPTEEVKLTSDGNMETAQMVMMTPVLVRNEQVEAVRDAEDSTNDSEATETLIESVEVATEESLSEKFEAQTEEAITSVIEDSEDNDARSDVDEAEVSTEEAVMRDNEDDTMMDDVENITDLPVEANEVRSEVITEEINEAEDTNELDTRDAEASTDEPIIEAVEISTDIPVEQNEVRSEVEISTDLPVQDNEVRSDVEKVEISTDIPMEENEVRSDVDEVEVSTDLPVEDNQVRSDDIDEVDDSTDEPIEEESTTDVPEQDDKLRSDLMEDNESTTDEPLAEAAESATENATEAENSVNELRNEAAEDEMIDATTVADIEAIEVSTDAPADENQQEIVEDLKSRTDLKDEESDSVDATTIETIMEAAESSTDIAILSNEDNEVRSDLDEEEESMDNEESEESSTDETPIEEKESTESPVEESESVTMETRDGMENEQKYWNSMKEVTVESELEKVAQKYGLRATPEVSYEVEEEKDQPSFASTIIANIRNTEENIEEPIAVAIEDEKEIISESHLDRKYVTKEEEKISDDENKYDTLEENESSTENKYETLEKEEDSPSVNKYSTIEAVKEESIKKPTSYGNRLNIKEVKGDKRESLINRFKTEDETKNELKRKRKFLASRRFFTARSKPVIN